MVTTNDDGGDDVVVVFFEFRRYVGGAAPRKQVVGNVFTANEAPPDVSINNIKLKINIFLFI